MIYIEGTIAVKAAILHKKRQIHKIYFKQDKFSKDISYIKYLAHQEGITFELKQEDFFQNYPKSGGVVAEVSARTFDALDDNDLIAIISGVEDPYNLAYIFRTGAAYGCSFILETKDFNMMEATLLKSSAGAFDSVNIYLSDCLLETIDRLKEKEYHIVSLYRNQESVAIQDYTKGKKNVLILGGEKRGIAKAILAKTEHVYIPYHSSFRNALNASSAFAIAISQFR